MSASYDLEAAAREIRYEVSMLRESFRLVNSHRSARERESVPDTTEIAFLESYAVHARNLIEFFSPRTRDLELDRGIQARHFVDTEGSFGVPTDERWLKGLDARLAHLSTDRLRYQNRPGWREPVEIYETLERAWAQFLDALPTEQRAWFPIEAEPVDPESSSTG